MNMGMKGLTTKQLTAILRSNFGTQTRLIHQLAEAALNASVINDDTRDELERLRERYTEETRVRPESERVLILVCRPLAADGCPCLEVYSDARVKVKIELEGYELPAAWQRFADNVPAQRIELQPLTKDLWEQW